MAERAESKELAVIPPGGTPTLLPMPARRKLLVLDAATDLRVLAINRGNHREALKKEWAGQHSIRLNDQWRICFVWKEGNAFNVEITDYH